MSQDLCLTEPRALREIPVAHLLISVEAPWHRVEQGAPETGRVPLLTAFRPELGWPRWCLRVPMLWHGGDVYERLPGALQIEAWMPPARGRPGDPWRFSVPLEQFPNAPEGSSSQDPWPGLLVLAVYLEPRVMALEGFHEGCIHPLAGEELMEQAEGALLQLLDLPPSQWRHGFVASPRTPQRPQERQETQERQGRQTEAREPLSFALAACQYPPGLLDVSPGCNDDPRQAAPAFAAMARLHHWARHHPDGRQLSLLLLAGDQIYADASGGLADSRSGVERYARAYGEFKGGPVRHLPPSVRRIVHSVDDHEIVDNWEPEPKDGVGPWFEAARQAAWDHRWEAGARTGGPHCLWHDFNWQGGAFFVADARCERQARRAANWSRARLWSEAQRDAFGDWLSRSQGQPRFLLCGSLPLPRRRTTAEHAASCLRSDAWDGYPHSLHELLGEIWQRRAEGLVFLSGDEHRSGYISARISAVGGAPEQAVQIHSIHSSALYAPWPFAITAAEELATPDVFEFDGPKGQRLRCEVGAWHDHPGDGVAVLSVVGRTLHLWFDRAERPLWSDGAGADRPSPCARLDLGDVAEPALGQVHADGVER